MGRLTAVVAVLGLVAIALTEGAAWSLHQLSEAAFQQFAAKIAALRDDPAFEHRADGQFCLDNSVETLSRLLRLSDEGLEGWGYTLYSLTIERYRVLPHSDEYARDAIVASRVYNSWLGRLSKMQDIMLDLPSGHHCTRGSI